MHTTIPEAQVNLPFLISRALAGDEVVIAQSHTGAGVKLTPHSVAVVPKTRVGGQWAGRVTFSNDPEFSAEEIDELFHNPPISGQ